MSVTKNKPISEHKELFLAICLLSGEVSCDTISSMKDYFGDVAIRNHVIGKLSKRKYIKKKGSGITNYSYRLTPKGPIYIETKLPGKYNYDAYQLNREYLQSAEGVERARQLSMVMFTLWKEGVSLENHTDVFANLLQCYEVHPESPMFISIREFKKLNIRFKALFGMQVYGFILTAEKIISVYSPNAEHNISTAQEKPFNETLTNILNNGSKPYKDNHNHELLYLYNNYNDIVDSFSTEGKINENTPVTKSVYDNYRTKKSYIFLPDNCYPLSALFDDIVYSEINALFWKYYDFKPIERNSSLYLHIDAEYLGKYPSAICWDLNPGTILDVFDYCKNEMKSKDRLMIVCFREQEELVRKIFQINKDVYSKLDFGCISCEQVLKVIAGESDYIE